MLLRLIGYGFRKLFHRCITLRHGGQTLACNTLRNPPNSRETNVTVIVPTRDKHQLLRVMLESLERTAPFADVIIVDNQSVELETLKYLKGMSTKTNYRVLKYDAKFNYAKICNMAAREAKTEFIVFANNDLVFSAPGWLENMLNHLEQTDVGLVGSILRYEDGRTQHAGIVMHHLGLANHYKEESFSDSVTQKSCPVVSGVTFALVALRSRTFSLLNGLDEEFGVGLNDVDFCLRMREVGMKIVCCAGNSVLHLESQSRDSMFSVSGFLRAFQEIALFYKKHGTKATREDFFIRSSR